MDNQTPEAAIEAAVATTAAEATPSRVRTTDEKFFEVNERIAKSGIGSGHVSKVAAELGITDASVTQRRNVFNRTYREHGLTLTPFTRGGGQRKDVNSIAAKLLAMRDEQNQPVENTES